MMMKNERKYIKKLEYQEKNNPGHKESYQPPLRPRSTVFKDKTAYDRSKSKLDIKKGKFD